jgi:hypothetical protein
MHHSLILHITRIMSDTDILTTAIRPRPCITVYWSAPAPVQPSDAIQNSLILSLTGLHSTCSRMRHVRSEYIYTAP